MGRADRPPIGDRSFLGVFFDADPQQPRRYPQCPWKTNEDRRNLLDGPYNDELVDAAAGLVAEELPRLATRQDPARHIDPLPLRPESDDNHHAQRLRLKLYALLTTRRIVPDQDGRLQAVTAVEYPPEALSSGRREHMARALDRWSAYPHRPSNWLHHSALTRERVARLNRLVDPRAETNRWHASGVPYASISGWLEAFVPRRIGGGRSGRGLDGRHTDRRIGSHRGPEGP